MNSLTEGTSPNLDALADEAMIELIERNKVRIQRLLAEAARLRVDQASIRAEMKRRERELYS